MSIRIAVCLVLLGLSLPRMAFAAQGILLLADEGKPEWNTQVTQLAASVDKQTPTEVAFWSGTKPSVQTAVDRLVQRGVSEIVAVPLFIAAPPPDLGSTLKSPVPLRVAGPLNGEPVAADVILGRAEEISRNPAADVLIIVSHRPARTDKRWVPDLGTAAQQLNRIRRFAMILTTTIPPDASEAPDDLIAQVRRLVERQIAMGRRILVVPVLTPYGSTESAIEEQLQGLAHDMAKSALMPDDRLVAWIVSRAEGK